MLLFDNCTEFSDFTIFIINTRVRESGQNLSIQMTRLEKPELNDCEDHQALGLHCLKNRDNHGGNHCVESETVLQAVMLHPQS